MLASAQFNSRALAIAFIVANAFAAPIAALLINRTAP
jgi:hypothetical protein